MAAESAAAQVYDARIETAEELEDVSEPAPRETQEVAEAITERAHALGRRGAVVSIVGVLTSDGDDHTWLIDRRYAGGCVAIRLDRSKAPSVADGQEVIATGSFWAQGEHWVFRAIELEPAIADKSALEPADDQAARDAAPEDRDDDTEAAAAAATDDPTESDGATNPDDPAAAIDETPSAAAAAIPEPRTRGIDPDRHAANPSPAVTEVSALAKGSRGRLVQVKIIEAPARFGEGWLVADVASPEVTARAQFPGESPIYGGQDFRSVDEAWPLRRGDTFFLEISWVRKARSGALVAFGVAKCPARAPAKPLLVPPSQTQSGAGPLNKPSTSGGQNEGQNEETQR